MTAQAGPSCGSFDTWAGVPTSMLGANIAPAFLSLPDDQTAASGSLPFASYNPINTTIVDDFNFPNTGLRAPFNSHPQLANDGQGHGGGALPPNAFTRISPSHHNKKLPKPSSPTRKESYSQEGPQREKYLERNRVAASKCRQKKKRETDQLKNCYQKEAQRKKNLEVEVKNLHTELLDLKDQLLRHSRCDDESIQLYLGQMVNIATSHDSMSSASSERSASISTTFENNPMPLTEQPPPPCVEFDRPSQILATAPPSSMGMTCGAINAGMGQYLGSQPVGGNIFDQLIRIP